MVDQPLVNHEYWLIQDSSTISVHRRTPWVWNRRICSTKNHWNEALIGIMQMWPVPNPLSFPHWNGALKHGFPWFPIGNGCLGCLLNRGNHDTHNEPPTTGRIAGHPSRSLPARSTMYKRVSFPEFVAHIRSDWEEMITER